MAQHQVFGVHGDVGLELGLPPTVLGACSREQVVAGEPCARVAASAEARRSRRSTAVTTPARPRRRRCRPDRGAGSAERRTRSSAPSAASRLALARTVVHSRATARLDQVGGPRDLVGRRQRWQGLPTSPAGPKIRTAAPRPRRRPAASAETTGMDFLRWRRSLPAACRSVPGRPRSRAGRRRPGRPGPGGGRSRAGPPPWRRGAPARMAPMDAAQPSRAPVLADRHGHALLDADVAAGLEGDVVGLTGDHRRGGVGQRRRRGRARLRRRLEEDLVGQDLQGVAGDDGRADAVHRPHRRPVMAFGVGVDDVVVDEREVVDQLDGHAAGTPTSRIGAGRLGSEHGQGGPDALAARRRSTGLPSASVQPRW